MKIKSVSKKSVILMEFDWVLFIATICLSVFGIVMIYSATRTLQSNTNVIVQSGAMVIGCAAMLVTCFFDYEQLKNLVKPIYIFAVAILLLVLVFGVSGDWGARSWIRFGAIGIQPSEIAKICFIVTFSCHLSKVHDDINKPLTILGLLLHIGVLVGLILLQPDMGSVLVFLFMFICLMFVAKLSYKYILPIGVAGVASLPFIYKYVLSEYQQKRIQVFFNPNVGPFNYILKTMGMNTANLNILGNPGTAIFGVIFASQWMYFGYMAMLLIIGIQKVPDELYEAAEIDGANALQRFWHITIPNIKEMILVDCIIIVVGSFKLFDEVFVMTNGGPGYASEVISTYLYRTAFRADMMGSASAMAVVLFVITFALSIFQMKISRSGEV